MERNRVLGWFLNTRYFKCWIKGLQYFRTVQGKKGKLGCRTRMIFQMGKHQKTIYKTLIQKNIPNCYGFQFDSDYGTSEVRYIFVPLANQQTLLETHTHLKLYGFRRLLQYVAPHYFIKKSQRHLEDFKRFAESKESQISESMKTV